MSDRAKAKEKILADIKDDVTPGQYAQISQLLNQHLVEKPREHLSRIPLLVPLLGTFGLVSTYYGFEKFLDTTPLINYPLELIALGVILLLLTGAAANKL